MGNYFDEQDANRRELQAQIGVQRGRNRLGSLYRRALRSGNPHKIAMAAQNLGGVGAGSQQQNREKAMGGDGIPSYEESQAFARAQVIAEAQNIQGNTAGGETGKNPAPDPISPTKDPNGGRAIAAAIPPQSTAKSSSSTTKLSSSAKQDANVYFDANVAQYEKDHTPAVDDRMAIAGRNKIKELMAAHGDRQSFAKDLLSSDSINSGDAAAFARAYKQGADSYGLSKEEINNFLVNNDVSLPVKPLSPRMQADKDEQDAWHGKIAVLNKGIEDAATQRAYNNEVEATKSTASALKSKAWDDKLTLQLAKSDLAFQQLPTPKEDEIREAGINQRQAEIVKSQAARAAARTALAGGVENVMGAWRGIYSYAALGGTDTSIPEQNYTETKKALGQLGEVANNVAPPVTPST